ncbi:DUF397 domain-containing protein [Streptomyces sp. SPB074]|uniref:DUF397 domain-containing protein n=1 Tax=Streptomyces sp. (strain SPB074) TaxID=465543 RepID=UPI00017F102E|nr:DUF397 domain-containing protein [Streptomyces sp. SPB074]
MVMSWKRSSYSGNNGGNCVEVGFEWRKSSYSENDGGNCVEVGTAGPSAPHVLVRDSKRAGEAAVPVLHLHPAVFTGFLGAVRTSTSRP